MHGRKIFAIGRFELFSDGSIYRKNWEGGRQWGQFGQVDQLIMYPENCPRLVLMSDEPKQIVKIKTAWIEFRERMFREDCSKATLAELENWLEQCEQQIEIHSRRDVPHGRTKAERQTLVSEIRRRELAHEEALQIHEEKLEAEVEEQRQRFYEHMARAVGVPVDMISGGPFDLWDIMKTSAMSPENLIDDKPTIDWDRPRQEPSLAEQLLMTNFCNEIPLTFPLIPQLQDEPETKEQKVKRFLANFRDHKCTEEDIKYIQQEIADIMDDGKEVKVFHRSAGQTFDDMMSQAVTYSRVMDVHAILMDR